MFQNVTEKYWKGFTFPGNFPLEFSVLHRNFDLWHIIKPSSEIHCSLQMFCWLIPQGTFRRAVSITDVLQQVLRETLIKKSVSVYRYFVVQFLREPSSGSQFLFTDILLFGSPGNLHEEPSVCIRCFVVKKSVSVTYVWLLGSPGNLHLEVSVCYRCFVVLFPKGTFIRNSISVSDDLLFGSLGNSAGSQCV